MESTHRILTDDEVAEFEQWLDGGEHGPILGLNKMQIEDVKQGVYRKRTEAPPYPGAKLKIAVAINDVPVDFGFAGRWKAERE